MQSLKNWILTFLVFLLPLFFLPLTQEFYITNKVYLLVFGGLLLLLISILEILISKKITWRKFPLDTAVLFLLLTVAASLVIASPNKVDTLLNPYFGFASFFGLTLLYFYLTQTESSVNYVALLNYSAIVISVITIFFFFEPFKNAQLPFSLQFLRNPSFSPLGTTLDLAIFLGFIFVTQAVSFIQNRKHRKIPSINHLVIYFIIGIALVIAIYTVMKAWGDQGIGLLLPPYRLSWYAAVELLKSPLNALFGIGIDNYSYLFAKVKDLAYNQSPFWQINSFNVARSGLLHLLTVTGLVSLVAFGTLIVLTLKLLWEKEAQLKEMRLFYFVGLVYLLLVFLLFPPSFIPLFLLFFMLALIVKDLKKPTPSHFELKELVPLFIGVVVLGLAFVGFSAYILGRTYLAERHFKQSLDAVVQNSNIELLYNNQRQAILLNPYLEKYRISFSQTNLAIASNIAQRGQTRDEQGNPVKLSDQEKQTVAQAVQTAIDEAKATLVLNPNKAANWENLANIYRSLINVAQQADLFTISSYQRAIFLDFNNPSYRVNLGGVYYSLRNYTDAVTLFSQAVSLKPDWPNAHYNLAWASYQKQDYPLAISEMRQVLALLDKKKFPADYKKAQSDLELFKKAQLAPQPDKEASGEGQLKLPQEPQPELSPKLELPETASPEARYRTVPGEAR